MPPQLPPPPAVPVQRRRVRRLIAELRILRTAMDELSALVYAKDLAGRYTFANRATQALYGAAPHDVLGADDSRFWDMSRSEVLRHNDRRVIEDGLRLESEEQIALIDSEARTYFSVKAPVRDARGRVTGVAGVSTDITHFKQLESELLQKNALLESLLENVDACIYTKDRARRYTYANAKMADVVGREPQELIGRTDEELVAPEVAANWRVLDDRVLATGAKQSGEQISTSAQGEIRNFWVVQIPQRDRSGEIVSLLGIATDFTQFYRLKEELARQATTDELTGVRNRRSLLEVARQEFQRATRYGHPLSVLMIDIDHFKGINDRHGHDVGDTVLRAVANACRDELRDSDVLGRLGGEEFGVVLPNTGRPGALVVAERLRARIDALRLDGDWGADIAPKVSVGVACMQGAPRIEAVLKQADQALYAAKAAGRNCVQVAESVGADGSCAA
ncbi:sensor domain-containing diguanylate cyclase [Lysobacter solisilvae (ex Woo and Kim 2020)]|uniref:Diguanylate cyclase n=1 Tax=Agrilutibacter terrestris TaxID=2865112 RepID=A0A7H0FVL3_9GAMM|nr:diguanylate cyclase [Lysobacter terrestris]QNP40079.1 diguanylate cyclase [Lysobacter terrestris]